MVPVPFGSMSMLASPGSRPARDDGVGCALLRAAPTRRKLLERRIVQRAPGHV
jgi:hypothetical protein